MRAIEDSGLEEFDTLASGSLNTPRVLKKVVIPVSRSSLASSISSLQDRHSDGDQTPLTSFATTPAEQLSTIGRDYTTRTRIASKIQLPAQENRKRTTAEDLIEADRKLAQSLQEPFWRGSESSQPVSKRRRRAIVDSDEHSDVLPIEATGILQTSSDDDEPLLAVSKKRKRRRPEKRILPDSDDDVEMELSEESDFDPDQAWPDSEKSNSDNADVSGSEAELVDFARAVAAQVRSRRGNRREPGSVVRRAPRSAGQRRYRSGGFLDRATRERKKLEKAHPEILTMWDELEQLPRINPCQIEQPLSITRKLKTFQLEGLDWMMKQEKSQWKGGLLGDEMGMGKTIQAVSLIMSDHPAKDPTLVVVPPVALMQWQTEIGLYTNGKLKVLVYHNTNPKVKTLGIKDLRHYDVILISYAGLESVYRKESKGWKRDQGLVKENSKIHALHYHRILLDEAHSIKTRTTSVAKACFALQADFKWCLSGTPVQNRIGEFFSLLRYLQVSPFASYLCKKCPCSRLHWDQDASKRCTTCRHTGLEHVSVFNQEILNPIVQQGDADLRREGLRKLRLITDRIMLRRLKRDHTASMELPPKDVIIHNEFFGEIERDFSASIMSNTNRQFDTYVSRGVMLNNYANIFGLIMQASNLEHGSRNQADRYADAASCQSPGSHLEKTCRG